MEFKEKLVPVSFHLRNFNNYISLDIDASQNGNLTLIGENTAGKTTLANCFFPMLVDGSIATPSFNPAKGTDKLDRISKVRNSSKDSRTFESMLLGWGKGAMKVRTGYSYMLMKSNKRQAIVGIGAHRAVGEKKGSTWWFVVVDNDPKVKLDFKTVDDKGRSLEKNEFIQKNEIVGNEFQIFTTVEDFQKYVSEKIYGFTDPRNLNHLATTYRLLASPILTAGSGRLTPILEAMKNAQEGIDNQIIDSVAEAQRDVNRKNFTSQRIERGQGRLQKLKKEIFWRNLNQLQRLIVLPYSKNQQDLDKFKVRSERLRQEYQDCLQQLEQLLPLKERTDEQVVLLESRKIKQDNIKEQRHNKKKQIDLLQNDISRYQILEARLKQQNFHLIELQQSKVKLKGSHQATENQIKSLLGDLKQNFESLKKLNKLLNQEDFTNISSQFNNYLLKMRRILDQYQAIKKNQENLSQDIKIVTEIRQNMDKKIDLRTQGPMIGRIRSGLKQDNLDVHNAGAAKMNLHYMELDQQCTALLEKNPDLVELLSQDGLFEILQNISKDFKQLVSQINEVTLELQRQTFKIESQQQDILTTKNDLDMNYPEYDLEKQQSDLAKYKLELTALVIDPDLDAKLSRVHQTQSEYQRQQRLLENKQISSRTNAEALKEPISKLNSELENLSKKCNKNLQDLSPYIESQIELKNIDQLLEFVHQHNSEIRNNNFGDLSERIGHLIHNNSSNNFDKYALDDIFEDRGHEDIASIMRQQKSIDKDDIRIVSFDINEAQNLIEQDGIAIHKALDQLESGNMIAQQAYLSAAVHQISDQYAMVNQYNKMLAHGSKSDQEIRLKVSLQPMTVSQKVIDEARDIKLEQRPELLEEVQSRLNKLANDTNILDDDFNDEARKLLDIRQWSEFKIWIHRKHSEAYHFEEVDDKFVQSGGSGAEKAQAMVLPLLLVPKMILNRSRLTDTPAFVMFDEFADKLDPETAKSFAKTIDHFGFNFLATMPGGAQNKILADGVENIAYDVIPPKNRDDGKFHSNLVRKALMWRES